MARAIEADASAMGLLLLCEDHDRFWYTLAGHRVKAGDALAVLLADGRWLPGVYVDGWRSGYRILLDVALSFGGSGRMELPADAMFRWEAPERRVAPSP